MCECVCVNVCVVCICLSVCMYVCACYVCICECLCVLRVHIYVNGVMGFLSLREIIIFCLLPCMPSPVSNQYQLNPKKCNHVCLH